VDFLRRDVNLPSYGGDGISARASFDFHVPNL
jgi:hypothetical protein